MVVKVEEAVTSSSSTEVWSGATPCGEGDDLFPSCLWRERLSRDPRQYHDVIEVLDHYITPALCVVGCVGNLLSLIVLHGARFRRADGGRETSAQVGLAFLAGSDLVLCVVLFPRYVARSSQSYFSQASFALYYQLYSTGCITTCILVSTWVMVAMATMRYLAICYPLTVRAYDGPKYARLLFSAVLVLCVLINLPTFWQYSAHPVDDTDDHSDYMIDIGALNYNKPSGAAFLWLRASLAIFLPAILLIFFNVSLIKALQKSYRMRRRYHVNEYISRSRSRITLMLVALVGAFIVLVFPSDLMDFFTVVVRHDAARTEVFLLIRSFANLLQTLNFTFNFAMYCALNVYFRGAARELLTCGVLAPGPAASTARQPAGATRWTFSTRHATSSRKTSDSLV